MNRATLFVLWMLAFAFLGLYTVVSSHELTHKRMYERYSIEADIQYSFPFGAKTIPRVDPYSVLEREDAKTLSFLNALVDVSTAVVMPVALPLFLLLGVVSWYVISRL